MIGRFWYIFSTFIHILLKRMLFVRNLLDFQGIMFFIQNLMVIDCIAVFLIFCIVSYICIHLSELYRFRNCKKIACSTALEPQGVLAQTIEPFFMAHKKTPTVLGMSWQCCFGLKLNTSVRGKTFAAPTRAAPLAGPLWPDAILRVPRLYHKQAQPNNRQLIMSPMKSCPVLL